MQCLAVEKAGRRRTSAAAHLASGTEAGRALARHGFREALELELRAVELQDLLEPDRADVARRLVPAMTPGTTLAQLLLAADGVRA